MHAVTCAHMPDIILREQTLREAATSVADLGTGVRKEIGQGFTLAWHAGL